MAASSSLQRNAAALGLVSLALVVIAVASLHSRHEGGELLQVSSRTARLESALHVLEGKLHAAGISTEEGGAAESDAANDDDLLMHAASESSGSEEPIQVPEAGNAGHEWTAEDQAAYDKEMQRATGETGAPPASTLGLPVGFLPIDNENEEEKYAQSLVGVLRNLKSGYWDELLGWAENGSEEENPYISPVVEAIEAPLVKELDTDAHKKVSKTVQEIALHKDLKPAEMKEMRARLLVPLLLRIRARVHKKVETYTVSMIRRIILDASEERDDEEGSNEGGADDKSIMAPSAGAKNKPSVDEQMEYALRDVDALYEKGALSERDYQAEKAKVLSDWLGDAIKSIGGKTRARKALKDFLWPPTKTVSGCSCLLPFKFVANGLGDAPITYEACTDIGSPGHAWCAVDPADENCGMKSIDSHAHHHEGGYGWTRWDWCAEQPAPPLPENHLASYYPRIETVHGCRCKTPFELYPKAMGGRRKVVLGRCTKYYGQDEDWCATEGECGIPGNPAGVDDKRLTWTHWDKCIGEPAGYLEPPRPEIKTVQGCTCMDWWDFKPHDLKERRITYRGCSDVDSPGTAWCAVKGAECGNASQDPRAGTGSNQYGWTHWDVCEDGQQPFEVMENLDKGILPVPVPFVRTENGCSCKLPYTLPNGDQEFRCTRYKSFSAWCPVNEEDCGTEGMGPHNKQPIDPNVGWSRWDRCVGEPAGFLPPPRPRVKTVSGCVCKHEFDYIPKALTNEVMTYTQCTDIDSPNHAWCAVDTELSPHECGNKSMDMRAHTGEGGYGWERWDLCVDQPTPIPQGLLPNPVPQLRTVQGCTCKLPYTIAPPELGKGTKMSMTTCNKYEPEGKDIAPFYWCPVEEQCGQEFKSGYMKSLGYTHWDKCIGEPAGFLEPEPTLTEQGCECLFPFGFVPKSLNKMKDGRAIYTSCTDSGAVADKSAWCATRGSCGRKSKRKLAFIGEGGFGWTHWDFCKVQPSVRALLPSGQPELPVPAPPVRTIKGCTCKLPFQYAPAKDCVVSQELPGVCQAKGGYLMSGYCVVCKVSEFTECVRSDQNSAWCAVEGDSCGVKSVDELALTPKSKGGYGWTNWDYCIGQPAGYMEHKPRKKKKAKSARSSKSVQALAGGTGITVEGMRKKFVYGGDHDDHEAAASAQHEQRDEDQDEEDRARAHEPDGENDIHERVRGRDAVIKHLEQQMASSIHQLNAKISQLNLNETHSGAVASSTATTMLGVVLAAVLSAVMQLLY